MFSSRKRIITIMAAAVLVCGAIAAHYALDPWGFYWKVSPEEAALRTQTVKTAEAFLGCREDDGSHKEIIDLYNSHEPLAMGYEVQYTDSWCAAFVSAVAIDCGLTDIIPTECSCQRQIELFRQLGCWEERDGAIPAPGDLIYYDWDEKGLGDCAGWADHVGMVVGVKWPFLKVIEGNRKDSVAYHLVPINDLHIRGFGRPDYAAAAKEMTP